jgi:hypothetical protein
MLTFDKFDEARRNSEVNTKLSAYEQLKPYKDDDSCYISFTTIDKLGINPKKTPYKTPLAIYSYNLTDTWNEYNVEKTKSLKQYPYVSDSPHIWVFKPKNPDKILVLADITDKHIDELKKHISKVDNNPKFDLAIEDCIWKTCPNIWWSIVQWYANEWKNPRTEESPNLKIKWSKFLIQLGLDGIRDTVGVIHKNEPKQSCFFNLNVIEIIDKIYNKDYSNSPVIIKSKEDVLNIPLNDIISVNLLDNKSNIETEYRKFKIENKSCLENGLVYYISSKNGIGKQLDKIIIDDLDEKSKTLVFVIANVLIMKQKNTGYQFIENLIASSKYFNRILTDYDSFYKIYKQYNFSNDVLKGNQRIVNEFLDTVRENEGL